ncbi:MAG: 1-acyl-sn-glycerol-3-phosphate acyltransferase [Bacteroidetes bacterium]|nr:1-acyl-sn-glycerol-3-phosphate acyltransferase [Bacteroidota bacterium]MBL6944483.1 1-acyl-sn-glycerol-3-phosphate acyltransferase [Bacteroidales bacterium]
MGFAKIEKKSIGYNLLKIKVGFWHNIIFYRKFIVLGKSNIPNDKPLIFTPNHQNALMDALALIFSVNKQLVFVARADIFKKPVVARILYFLKLLPIYRVRDGFDTIKKSKDIIRKTIDIITSGSAMGILPEGNHSSLRRLQPLKKGFARMAFQAEEANNFMLDIHIVPVGIDYDNKQNYRSSLIVNFGEPIAVKDYVELYKNKPAVAINNIKQQLSERIKHLTINIESENNYDLYNELRVIYRSRMAQKLNVDAKKEHNRIFIDQQTIKLVSLYEKSNPTAASDYQKHILKFARIKDKFGFTNKIIEQKGRGLISLFISTLILAITFPLFFYGAINNFLSYWLPINLSKKIKDTQFISSIKFVISLLSFPVFYIIQSLIVLLVFDDWKIALVYLLSIPLTAPIAWWWRGMFIRTKIGLNYTFLRWRKNKEFSEMQNLYDEIITRADSLTGI